MSDKLATRIYIYDSICNAYSKLNNVEKEDFDKGLTMLFSNKYFAKNKKSNIDHSSQIINEIMDLSAVAIKLSYLISGTDKFNNLVDISRPNEINTFYDELIKEKKINGKVLLSFIRVLKSMAIISIMSDEKDEAEIKAIISKVNLYFEIIQSRHNFDINKLPIESKIEYKGKPTIILRKDNLFSQSNLHTILYKNNFIDSNQSQKLFYGIFGEKEITIDNRVIWIDSNYSLNVFLKRIRRYTVFRYDTDLFITATRCFVKQNGNQFEFLEILKARGDIKIASKFDEIFKKVEL